MDKDELEKSFEYFLENISEFRQKYNNKFIVIKNCKVLGVYNTYEEALETSLKTHEIGTFIIQKVSSNPAAYTLYLNQFSVKI